MSGIVIVAHSTKLDEGVRDLAIQMAHDRVPIALAAGLDDARAVRWAEVRAAKAMLAQAEDELHQHRIPFAENLDIGIMIEVPAALLVAEQLAREVKFFSIGTNDLTQYVMAADRGNPKVADLVNALQPAVIRAIDQVVKAAHVAGIWVGMCGEMAGNPLAMPLLLGLGLDELSMNTPMIPAVKQQIRQTELAAAQQLAAAVLAVDSVAAIAHLLT